MKEIVNVDFYTFELVQTVWSDHSRERRARLRMSDGLPKLLLSPFRWWVNHPSQSGDEIFYGFFPSSSKMKAWTSVLSTSKTFSKRKKYIGHHRPPYLFTLIYRWLVLRAPIGAKQDGGAWRSCCSLSDRYLFPFYSIKSRIFHIRQ